MRHLGKAAQREAAEAHAFDLSEDRLDDGFATPQPPPLAQPQPLTRASHSHSHSHRARCLVSEFLAGSCLRARPVSRAMRYRRARRIGRKLGPPHRGPWARPKVAGPGPSRLNAALILRAIAAWDSLRGTRGFPRGGIRAAKANGDSALRLGSAAPCVFPLSHGGSVRQATSGLRGARVSCLPSLRRVRARLRARALRRLWP
jgi:hypothetical protein